VLHLRADGIGVEESGQSSQSGTKDEDAAADHGFRFTAGRVAWPDSEEASAESGQGFRPDAAARDGDGRDGRIGRLLTTAEPATHETVAGGSTIQAEADAEEVEWSA
jgi:hypothetical protein